MVVADHDVESAGSSTPTRQGEAAAPELEVLVLLDVPADQEQPFLRAMVANVEGSRQEEANASFTLFRDDASPSEAARRFMLIARWDSQAGLDAHMDTPHLKRVLETNERLGVAGEQLTLEPLFSTPSGAYDVPADPDQTRNVVVTFEIKPCDREAFLEKAAQVVEPSRGAPGNLYFQFYGVAERPNTIVLLERWESAGAHDSPEAGLQLAVLRRPGGSADATGHGRPIIADGCVGAVTGPCICL